MSFGVAFDTTDTMPSPPSAITGNVSSSSPDNTENSGGRPRRMVVIRAFGVDGLIERLREHCVLARELAAWIEASEDWELMAPVPFSLVCFRYAPAGAAESERDRLNEAIMHDVNATGDVFLSHTRLHDRFTLRAAIGNIRTEARHARRLWDRLREAAKLAVK